MMRDISYHYSGVLSYLTFLDIYTFYLLLFLQVIKISEQLTDKVQ